MNALEKSRLICYGKNAVIAKDARVARLQRDFAQHFTDSIDYQPDTLINGSEQPLIVSKNKSNSNEKKIYAYPGQTFYPGDVVDCYNAKWLVTFVDQNNEVYTSGVMELCNRELIWQNRETGEIIKRWITAEKPYYANIYEAEVLTVSTREFKIQVAYDEETAQIDLDKRFMLEIVGGKPRTYNVTCVDTVTERYYQSGTIRGFLVLNVRQDLYNPETDNAELMICDYIDPQSYSTDTTPATNKTYIKIDCNGTHTIRQGGSAKTFTVHFFNGSTEIATSPITWDVQFDSVFNDKILSTINPTDVQLQALDYVELQGAKITLTASDGTLSDSMEIEVTA